MNPQPLPSLPQDTSLNDNINSVGRPIDKAKADDDEARKANRRSKGEALLALGAGLLSAPNFNQGMAQGLMAYVKTLHESQDRNKPKHEDVAGGAYDKVTNPDGSVSYDRTPVADYLDNKQFVVVDGKVQVARIGATAKTDTAKINTEGANYRTRYSTDARSETADEDRTSREHIAQWNNASDETVARITGQFRAANRNPNKLEVAAAQRAQVAPENIARYARIDSLLASGNTGVGAGLWNKLRRSVASVTGQDSMGVDVENMQLLDTDLQTIKAQAGATLLGGQGQVSDGERKMVELANPRMDMDPDAIRQVVGVLRAKAQRDAMGLAITPDGVTYPIGSTPPSASPHAPSNKSTSTGVTWRVVH